VKLKQPKSKSWLSPSKSGLKELLSYVASFKYHYVEFASIYTNQVGPKGMLRNHSRRSSQPPKAGLREIMLMKAVVRDRTGCCDFERRILIISTGFV